MRLGDLVPVQGVGIEIHAHHDTPVGIALAGLSGQLRRRGPRINRCSAHSRLIFPMEFDIRNSITDLMNRRRSARLVRPPAECVLATDSQPVLYVARDLRVESLKRLPVTIHDRFLCSMHLNHIIWSRNLSFAEQRSYLVPPYRRESPVIPVKDHFLWSSRRMVAKIHRRLAHMQQMTRNRMLK